MARRGRSGTTRKTPQDIPGSIKAGGTSLAIGAQAGDEARANISEVRDSPSIATPPPVKSSTLSSQASSPPPARPAAPAPSPASPSSDLPSPAHTQPPLLFEVAWEVCWQLGGIYTVLRSKIAAMQKRWGDRYCLIGPYNPVTAAVEFDTLPAEEPYLGAITDLRNQGIPVHYGRWLVPGRPRTILIDYRARYSHLDSDKYTLWKDHGISSYSNDGEVNEVVAFGMACAEFMRLMTEHVKDRPLLAHFHEWMAGVAVPRISHLNLPIATVFTTHATLLGRYIAGENPAFYEHLPFLNPDAEAAKYNITPRFQIERAAAHASTVFTTVSEVTATEAEHLLGRTIDRLLPNGLNIQRFQAPHEFQAMHSQYKERIHEFVMGHFFPAYTFDLDNTIYLFTSGRYEYRNKGMDLFIEALHRLNQRLKHVPDRPTVVAFIITRAPTRNINVGVLQNQSMFDDLRTWCDELQSRIGRRLFRTAANGKLPTFEDLITDDSLVRLKQFIHAWRNGRQPPIVTHDLQDDSNDAVLKHLRHRNLVNSADDAVKVVFHPEFVTHTSPLLNLDYEQFVRGCHMGVFPSYYEPWGYTPMETIAMGLPAVTTDLSGFGAYVNRNIPDNDSDGGICVLSRLSHPFEQSVEELVEHLMGFAKLNRRQRIELRNKVERVSEIFDWSNLVSRYHDAHDLAIDRLQAGKRAGKFELRMV